MLVVSYCSFTRKISGFLIIRERVTVYGEHHVKHINNLHEETGEYFFWLQIREYLQMFTSAVKG